MGYNQAKIFYLLIAMMGKRKLLILILEGLLPYWELAEGFLLLLKENDDPDFVDQLYVLLLESIKKVKSQQLKAKLSENLKQLREKERLAELRDQEEADKIFNDLFDELEEYAG